MFARYRDTMMAWDAAFRRWDARFGAVTLLCLLCILPATAPSMLGVLFFLPACLLLSLACGALFGAAAMAMSSVAAALFLALLFVRLLSF